MPLRLNEALQAGVPFGMFVYAHWQNFTALRISSDPMIEMLFDIALDHPDLTYWPGDITNYFLGADTLMNKLEEKKGAKLLNEAIKKEMCKKPVIAKRSLI